VFKGIKQLLAVRKRQTAFHPNATQFTLHLGEGLFGFWRQSIDRQQSIFCVYNISSQPQSLTLADLNLINTQQWVELISITVLDEELKTMQLAPYQTLWLSNRA